MRFYIFRNDFAAPATSGAPDPAGISETTSVRRVKAHFFAELAKIGAVEFIDEGASGNELRALFAQPDVVYAYVHGDVASPAHEAVALLPKRSLWHSLGSLMLPDKLAKTVAKIGGRVNLVTTEFQKVRLQRYLRKAIQPLAVLAPPVDTALFRPPTPSERETARTRHGLDAASTHIVYAGRFLVTKGICQLTRALSLLPIDKAVVTLAGSYEPSFELVALSSNHGTFEPYFRTLCAEASQPFRLNMLPALRAEGLRDLFWSADAVVFPSWHEDENYGITAREASLCGAPVVVTDFGGLADLAGILPWGGVATYPTPVGVRFSLRELCAKIDAALRHGRANAAWTEAVRAQLDPHTAHRNLRAAVDLLLNTPLSTPESDQDEQRRALERFFEHAHDSFAGIMVSTGREIPDGLFAYGTSPHNLKFPRNEFFTAVQGMYTTSMQPPTVEAGSQWRGFFSCRLWQERRALVEEGYPGPRIRRFGDGEWRELTSCAKTDPGGEAVLHPVSGPQCAMVQGLVEAGYLVPD